ncbi:MAG TPA: class I SAM-dependent methyltransferase [Burkholderiales bacterium]|jgi:SAM-dependent methyltransferase
MNAADTGIDYSLHYRKWNNHSPEHVAATSAYYQGVAGQHLPARRDAAILDVGCGIGLTLAAYGRLGYTNCGGIDISSEQVAAARAQGINAEYVADSAAFLLARPASYDFISAFDVLEHLPEDLLLPLLRAIHTALKPGGAFLCVVPNANCAIGMRWRYIDWTHRTSFTEHSLEFVLASGGFAAPAIGEVNFHQRRPPYPFLPRPAVARWLLARFFRFWQRLQFAAEFGYAPSGAIPLSLNIMGVARRSQG